MSIFNANLRKFPVAPDVDVEKMARALDGFSGADITEICQRAAKNAIRESVNAGIERARRIEAGEIDENSPEENAVPFIRRDHFEEAMGRARRSVSDAEIRKYEEYTAKMKSDAAKAGAGGFSFDQVDSSSGEAGTGGEANSAAAGADDELY